MQINRNVFYSPKDAFEVIRDNEIALNDHSDILLAILLTHLRDFYDDIESIKKRLDIKVVIVYKDLRSLIELYFQINTVSKYELEDLIEKMLIKYHLTDNWNISIISAVLTNKLVIPEREINVRVSVPDVFYKDEVIDRKYKYLEEDIIKKGVQKALQQTYPVIKYPAIYFTQYTSPSSLATWIIKNRKIVESIQYFSPKKQNKRINIKTIHWGHLAWILKQAGFSGWTAISEELEKISAKHNKDNDNVDEVFVVIPTPDELEKMYKSYMATMQKTAPFES